MRKPRWWEWVAVVLVALLLVVMLYPLARPPSDRDGMRTACLSNVKQCAVACAIYTSDHDGRLPPAATWMDSLNPDTKTQHILHCPKAPRSTYGYAFNQDLSSAWVDNLPEPKAAILVFDSMSVVKNAAATPDQTPRPPRHEGRNNFSFVDTHAKSIPATR